MGTRVYGRGRQSRGRQFVRSKIRVQYCSIFKDEERKGIGTREEHVVWWDGGMVGHEDAMGQVTRRYFMWICGYQASWRMVFNTVHVFMY